MTRFHRFAVPAALALLSACASAGGRSGGGDPWTTSVRNQLSRAATTAAQQGLRLMADPYVGSLRQGASTDLSINLNAGRSYMMVGVCDQDCSDVDLRLFDPSGNEVDSDLLADDVPIVDTRPARSGTYRVRVIMTACRTEPCRFGVGLYGN